MQRIFSFTTVTLLLLLISTNVQAQLPETLSDRYIRVAEMGELVDSINVWGDVGSAGRYLVPEGTNLPDLISFSFGYLGPRSLDIDWTKTQIEVKVSRYDGSRRYVEVAYFRYRYHDPEPIELWEFELQNNDVVTLQVRRRPSLADYVSVIAPVLSVLTTSILLIDRLRN